MKKSVARWFERERVCRVASANAQGMPHLVPVCPVVADGRIYYASASNVSKVRNLVDNLRVAVTVDVYSDDWTHIKGAMVQGTTRLFAKGPRFRRIRPSRPDPTSPLGSRRRSRPARQRGRGQSPRSQLS